MTDGKDVAENVPDAGRAYLASKHFCQGCGVSPIDPKDLGNFIIAFWHGHDDKTGEPIIRDGIFDENGRIAVMKACTGCGPKIKLLRKVYAFETKRQQLEHLPDGPLKKMLREIWPRLQSGWKLEIGWEILLPVLQKMKQEKVRKRLAIRREDEAVDRLKGPHGRFH